MPYKIRILSYIIFSIFDLFLLKRIAVFNKMLMHFLKYTYELELEINSYMPIIYILIENFGNYCDNHLETSFIGATR